MNEPRQPRPAILETIVRRERERMEGRRFSLPRRARPLEGAGPFEGALREARLPVIAEFKRASPSLGPFAREADVAERIQSYRAGGAACLSILAEPEAFLGRPGDFDTARASGLPVLYKGFVCTPEHLEEAAAFGAQAVLLIAAVLGDDLPVYAADARRLGLEPLAEIHAPGEIPPVRAARVRMVGWNVRDLRDFSQGGADLPLLREAFPEALLVRESGLRTPAAASAALAEGFDALLMGEALMREADPAAFLAGVTR